MLLMNLNRTHCIVMKKPFFYIILVWNPEESSKNKLAKEFKSTSKVVLLFLESMSCLEKIFLRELRGLSVQVLNVQFMQSIKRWFIEFFKLIFLNNFSQLFFFNYLFRFYSNSWKNSEDFPYCRVKAMIRGNGKELGSKRLSKEKQKRS